MIQRYKRLAVRKNITAPFDPNAVTSDIPVQNIVVAIPPGPLLESGPFRMRNVIDKMAYESAPRDIERHVIEKFERALKPKIGKCIDCPDCKRAFAQLPPDASSVGPVIEAIARCAAPDGCDFLTVEEEYAAIEKQTGENLRPKKAQLPDGLIAPESQRTEPYYERVRDVPSPPPKPPKPGHYGSW